MGVHSEELFDRVEIREIVGDVENEFFGRFYTGVAPEKQAYANPATGSRYFLTERDTWLGAQEQAVAAGGNLVTINDAAEEQWLLDTFGSVQDNLFIGFNDSEIFGKRAWGVCLGERRTGDVYQLAAELWASGRSARSRISRGSGRAMVGLATTCGPAVA